MNISRQKVPRFEANINGKWHEVTGINYHTYEPTIDFVGEDGKGHINGRAIVVHCEQFGWPLRGTELRVI